MPALAFDITASLAATALVATATSAASVWPALHRRRRPEGGGCLRWLWPRVLKTQMFVDATHALAGGVFVVHLTVSAEMMLGVPQDDRQIGVVLSIWVVGALRAIAAYQYTVCLPVHRPPFGAAALTLLLAPRVGAGGARVRPGRHWLAVAGVPGGRGR
jgi:hypothetical protein